MAESVIGEGVAMWVSFVSANDTIIIDRAIIDESSLRIFDNLRFVSFAVCSNCNFI